MQADGRLDLQSIFNGNEGDDGDPFPGASNNMTFGANTIPIVDHTQIEILVYM
jgi:hypothetical protein